MKVALILDFTACVARGSVEVDDAGIQEMCPIEFPKHRAVQPLIGPRGAEFCSTEHRRFPLGHLNALHAAANVHGVLPRHL